MGAVSFAVGAEGSTYVAKDGTEYHLTGWTLDAIAQHERFLEQRAVDALNRLKLTGEQRAAAQAALAQDIAVFAFAYGGERFDKSLKTIEGLSHFFWQLAKAEIKLVDAQKLTRDDPAGVQEAVYYADPTNRPTVEPEAAKSAK